MYLKAPAEEVAERLGVKAETVKWHCTPSGTGRRFKCKKPRREIVKMEE